MQSASAERCSRVEQGGGAPSLRAPFRAACSPAALVGLTLVLGTGWLLRLLLLTGPVGSDDTRYLAFADHIVSLRPFVELDHAAGRLLFLVLIGIPYKLGGHPLCAALANVLYSSLTDLLVVGFCYRRLGIHAALVAAVAMAFNAINVLFAGTILPDTTAALFLTSAVVVFWEAQGEEARGRRLRRIALSGALACLAYMCKDPGILFLPVGAALLFLAPKERSWHERLLGPAAFAGAFAAVFFLDGAVYWLYTGQFTYKMLATAACHNEGQTALSAAEHLSQGVSNLRMVLSKWSLGGMLLPLLVGVPALAAVGVVRRGWLVFSAAGLFFLAYSIFGTSSFTRLLPLPFQPRYLQPVIPLVAISLAALADRLVTATGMKRAWVLPACLGALLSVHDFRLVREWSGTLYFSPTMKSLRTAVELLGHEGRPVFVDSYLLMHSRPFLAPETHRLLQPLPAEGPLPVGFYVIGIPEYAGLPAERLAEVAKMKVRLRLDLDWRELNRFRQLRPRGGQPLVVYEKLPAAQPSVEGDTPP